MHVEIIYLSRLQKNVHIFLSIIFCHKAFPDPIIERPQGGVDSQTEAIESVMLSSLNDVLILSEA